MTAEQPTTEHPYLEKVRARLRGFFDFEPVPAEFEGLLGSWAHFVQTDEKYFLSRKMNLYTVNAHRFIGIDVRESVTPEDLDRVFAALRSWARKQGPGEQTMSTEYTAALISRRAVSEETAAHLGRLRCQVGFAMGLKGWADVGLVVADLENERVYSNPFGKEQLQTTLWSFNDKPVIPPSNSWISKIRLIRCGCTG